LTLLLLRSFLVLTPSTLSLPSLLVIAPLPPWTRTPPSAYSRVLFNPSPGRLIPQLVHTTHPPTPPSAPSFSTHFPSFHSSRTRTPPFFSGTQYPFPIPFSPYNTALSLFLSRPTPDTRKGVCLPSQQHNDNKKGRQTHRPTTQHRTNHPTSRFYLRGLCLVFFFWEIHFLNPDWHNLTHLPETTTTTTISQQTPKQQRGGPWETPSLAKPIPLVRPANKLNTPQGISSTTTTIIIITLHLRPTMPSQVNPSPTTGDTTLCMDQL
jgi:hypothetical protein